MAIGINKIITWENIQFAGIMLVFFMLGLNIPKVSYIVVLGSSCLLVLPWLIKAILGRKNSKNPIMKKSFIISSITIITFSVVYYTTVYNYDLIDELVLLYGSTFPFFSYLLGYKINFLKLPNRKLSTIYAILALIGGSILFVYLSVRNSPGSSDVMELITRKVPSIWKSDDEFVNGPVFDLYSMLGTCLLPITIFGKSRFINLISYKIIVTISLLLFCLALYSVVALQGRKALVSVVIAVIVTTIFKFSRIKNLSVRFAMILCLTLVTIGFLAFSGSIYENLINNYAIFYRLSNQGLDTPRYQTWTEILQSMPDNLLGGRSFSISSSYAHNIWLDTFYDGGLIPMLLLLLFHTLHIKPILKIVFSQLPDIFIICVICVVVALLMGFQVEPVLQASTFYFSISCCFFGCFLGLSQVANSKRY